jgi:hypothetical protein
MELGFPANKQGVLPYGDKVCIRFPSLWVFLDLATGRELGRLPIDVGNDDETFVCRFGRLLLSEVDGQHCGHQVDIIDMNNHTIIGRWDPPNKATTSYSVPIAHPLANGRWYIRGWDKIHCYDITKDAGAAGATQRQATVRAAPRSRLTAMVTHQPAVVGQSYNLRGQVIVTDRAGRRGIRSIGVTIAQSSPSDQPGRR